MISFEPIFNIGHALELLILATSAVVIITTLRRDVVALKDQMKETRHDVGEQMEQIRDDMGEISRAITCVARQDERLKALSHRVDILERMRSLQYRFNEEKDRNLDGAS